MAKSQLSVRDQIGLVLGVLLFFTVAVTIAGYAGSMQTREKLAAFASDGATVTGTVTNKYTHVVSKNWVYWVVVNFKAHGGKAYNYADEVPNTIYDGLKADDRVQITYVKAKPEWFYIAGNAPTERDVAVADGMFEYGLIMGLLFLVALIVFVCWSRSGGTSGIAMLDAGSQRKYAFRPPPPQSRSGFGTRGR